MATAQIGIEISNITEFTTQIEEVRALLARHGRSAEPDIAKVLLELFNAFEKSPIELRGESEPHAAVGAGKLSVQVQFAPRVLEAIAALRAIDGELV
jgi:plasmid stability protein